MEENSYSGLSDSFWFEKWNKKKKKLNKQNKNFKKNRILAFWVLEFVARWRNRTQPAVP